jgi:anaerobic magnesium-protoporphyrin IX monomethyl ester cyclase
VRATIANVVLGPGGETHLPIGPLHVVRSFQDAGWSVDFRDYQLTKPKTPLKLDTLLEFLDTRAPVLGVSCYFNLLPLVVLALEEIKRRDPDKLFILGGPGPSAAPENLMRAFPVIDIIVRGEGEQTVTDLLGRLGGELDEVQGIFYRRNGEVIATPPRPRIQALDALPPPAYDAVDLSRYNCVAIHTARGCPFDCGFCQIAPLWGRVTRNRGIARVVDEIEMLYSRHGIGYVRIADDTMTLSRPRVLDFAAAMRQRLPKVRWSCMARLDLVDDKLLAAMAKGGCVGIQYGVESGSPAVLERVGRRYSTAQALKAIRLSAKHMDHVVCTFIWGFPFETMDDFFMTISLMGKVAELGADVKLLCLMPMQLSSLYQEFGDELEFDPRLAASTIYSGYTGELDEQEEGKALDFLLDFIARRPRLFPDFHYFRSDTFERKRSMLASLRMA